MGADKREEINNHIQSIVNSYAKIEYGGKQLVIDRPKKTYCTNGM